MGITSRQFNETLEDLNVSDSDIKRVQQDVAQTILNALIAAGNTVVEDYEHDKV